MTNYNWRARLVPLKVQQRDSKVEPLDEAELELARELDATRPRFRGDCIEGPRPCPYLSCRYHLALEVTWAGSIRMPHEGRELDELDETCALDVADKGGVTLDRVAELLALSRERIRQIEELVLRKTKKPMGGHRG